MAEGRRVRFCASARFKTCFKDFFLFFYFLFYRMWVKLETIDFAGFYDVFYPQRGEGFRQRGEGFRQFRGKNYGC